jgi:hypothetical protein
MNRVVLIVLGTLASGVMLLLLAQGVREGGQLEPLRDGLHAAYALALVWFLVRTGPKHEEPTEAQPTKLRAWTPAAVLLLLLVFVLASDDGVDVLQILMMVAVLVLLLAWFRTLRLSWALQGLGLSGFAVVAGLLFVQNGVIPAAPFFIFAGLAIPSYVVGIALQERTGLSTVQLREGRYLDSLKSFGWGCLLFVPFGLVNAAGGSTRTGWEWVTEWWMPFVTPWFSGIVEEAWWRLLLLGLCFYLLRPAFRSRAWVAVAAAVLFSGVAFGVNHGRDLEGVFTTGLLFGVPFGVAFARRDWEHAVGAHYIVNMVPALSVFLENS